MPSNHITLLQFIYSFILLDDYFTPLSSSNLHSPPPRLFYLDNFASYFTDKIEVIRAFPQVPPIPPWIDTYSAFSFSTGNCPGSQLRLISPCPLDASLLAYWRTMFQKFSCLSPTLSKYPSLLDRSGDI